MDDSRGRRASQQGYYVPLAPRRAPAATTAAAAAAGDAVMAFAPQPAMLPSSSSIEATLSAFNRSIAMRLMAPQQAQQLQHPMQSKKQLKPLLRRIQEPPPEEFPPPLAPPTEEFPPQLAPPTIETAIRPTIRKRQREDNTAGVTPKLKDVADDEDKSTHVLMPNLGGAKLTCRLCNKRGLKTRSRYGCVQCRLGFHVACFAVFHYPTKFASNPSATVQDALDALDHKSASRPTTRRRANNSINSLALSVMYEAPTS